MIKICQECGKEFEATNGMQKFCKDQHYRRCIVCGNTFPVSNYHLTAKDAKQTCSKKCSVQLRKQTNLDKYGGVAPACSKEVRDKMEATNLDRYGVTHAAQSDKFKQKSIHTSLERYGVSHYAKTVEGRQRLSDRWNDEDFKSKVASNIVKTNLNKYGVKNVMQCAQISDRYIESHMIDSTKLRQFLSYKADPKKFINGLNLDHKPSILELQNMLGVNASTVGVYIHKSNCEDMVELHISNIEQEVTHFIKSIKQDIIVQNNIHNIITPKEIDIYLPDYKIGIECNPTCSHNSSVPFIEGQPLPYPYHKMQTDMCEENGVFLFHIFGYEWTHRRSVIESMIRNLLNANTEKLYARKLDVRPVDAKHCYQFLNENHRQGNANSSIRLGLYHDKELVSVMTFGKMRNSIGTGNEDLSDCWELVRFCSKLNTTVVGGAGKLFSYFVKTYDPVRIRSFSDRAHTRGDLYHTLGFTELRLSDPGYVWVDSKTDIAYNRYNAQKQNIKKFLHDDSIDLSKTEKQIMEEHGYVQVFDSGTITWQWLNTQSGT